MERPLVQLVIRILILWCTRVYATYLLSGNPPTIVVGDKVTMILTCTTDDDLMFVRWRQITNTANVAIAEVKNNCVVAAGDSYGTSNGYNYSCDLDKKEFFLSIAVENLSEVIYYSSWLCSPLFGIGSNKWSPAVLVPVTNLAITPVGINSVVSITEGDSLAFTCTTDSGRPAASIQWYIGERNVTDQATSVITADGTKFISSSKLIYTGKDADHYKLVYCEAMNIKERKMLKSAEKVLYLQIPVSNITITAVDNNNVVSVTEGKSRIFSCKTDASRPAALIQWYVEGQNMTNQATNVLSTDGNKFISTSTINYTGKDADHNKIVYCEAVNIEGRQKVQSMEKTLYIQLPITSLSITSDGYNSVVNVVPGENQTFVCTTDSSRPAAWINWYIGNQIIANKTTLFTTTDGTKFISTGSLIYTGNDADNYKVVYCEAANIEGGQKVKSLYKTLNIFIPVTVLMLTPAGINDVVIVVSGATIDFTCTANKSRPAAWIQWYIGQRNFTNDAVPQPPHQDDTKFISFSKLTYTAKVDDNNKTVYCEAGNIERRPKAKSANKILRIGFRPHRVIDLKAVCDVVSMVVTWRSESNGGTEQMFRVVRQNLHSNILTSSDNLSDPGFGNIVQYTTKQLSPKSHYKVYIESTNAYGTIHSDEPVYCTTSVLLAVPEIGNPALEAKESTLSFLSGFGLGAVAIIFINILTVMAVCLLKKRRQALADRSNTYEQSKNKAGDANVYNELNEIPRERQNQTDTSDGTYENISDDTNGTSKTDDKRRKRDIH